MAKERDDLSVLRDSAGELDFDFEQDNEIVLEEDQEARVTKLFLGMTAVERMFLSIFLFMNVAIIGLALLLATGRVVF
ncbi:MAG: hypothetical protein H6671_12570 [Anaerolineaceae bacterium]|nr:hypothetical protein [Anaerolineaceae bacterium]